MAANRPCDYGYHRQRASASPKANGKSPTQTGMPQVRNAHDCAAGKAAKANNKMSAMRLRREAQGLDGRSGGIVGTSFWPDRI